MNSHQETTSRLDRELRLVASRRRRTVLQYLVREPSSSASIDELADRIAADSPPERTASRESIRIELHHSVLPNLEDHGLVDYDPRSDEIRYRSHDRIETLLETLPDDATGTR